MTNKWIKNDSGSSKTWGGQTISNGAYYQIQSQDEADKYGRDTIFFSAIDAGDALIASDNSGNTDFTDPTEGWKFLLGLLAYNVRTRGERSDISMKLCRNSKVTTSSNVTLEFKVPGTYGTDTGREIEGGFACFGTPAPGDYISEINVIDKDNVTGLGANTILKTWHDSDITNYQSKGIWLTTLTEIHSMGDWGLIPSGVYLQLKATKASGDDTLYISLVWGEPD